MASVDSPTRQYPRTHLLGIPAEVRNQILGSLFTSSISDNLKLLLVCRQTYDEFNLLALHSANFVVKLRAEVSPWRVMNSVKPLHLTQRAAINMVTFRTLNQYTALCPLLRMLRILPAHYVIHFSLEDVNQVRYMLPFINYDTVPGMVDRLLKFLDPSGPPQHARILNHLKAEQPWDFNLIRLVHDDHNFRELKLIVDHQDVRRPASRNPVDRWGRFSHCYIECREQIAFNLARFAMYHKRSTGQLPEVSANSSNSNLKQEFSFRFEHAGKTREVKILCSIRKVQQ